MSFMRLGTRVAVINDDNEILLSKRGDFGTWALPGGRVDSGELIQDCAVREVYEETGLQVVIERAVGLYYQQGRSRTDVLYRAKPVGGELFSKTDETLENRFFAPDNLPEIPFGKFYIDHAYSDKTYLHTIETPGLELLKLDLQLRWRWLKNLLAGRPEPKFPQFDIRAVGIIRQADKVYAENGSLPFIISDGKFSLDVALTRQLHPRLKSKLNWQWTGVFQHLRRDIIMFIFESHSDIQSDLWTSPQTLHFPYRRFFEMTPTPDNIWFLSQEV